MDPVGEMLNCRKCPRRCTDLGNVSGWSLIRGFLPFQRLKIHGGRNEREFIGMN